MTDANGTNAAFDDLTLGEVELISIHALGGKSFGDDSSDPMMIAGGVMWVTQRRMNPALTWEEFKATTKMADIKSFSLDVESANELDPTNGRNALTT